MQLLMQHFSISMPKENSYIYYSLTLFFKLHIKVLKVKQIAHSAIMTASNCLVTCRIRNVET